MCKDPRYTLLLCTHPHVHPQTSNTLNTIVVSFETSSINPQNCSFHFFFTYAYILRSSCHLHRMRVAFIYRSISRYLPSEHYWIFQVLNATYPLFIISLEFLSTVFPRFQYTDITVLINFIPQHFTLLNSVVNGFLNLYCYCCLILVHCIDI